MQIITAGRSPLRGSHAPAANDRMKRWIRLTIGSLAVLTVLLGGIALWLWQADLGILRPQIERIVTRQVGREFRIDGRLNIDLGDRTHVIAEQVSLQNADWATEPGMLQVGRFEISFDLWSLLEGPFVIYQVDIDGIDLHLARPADGDPNWVLGPESTSPADAEEVDAPLLPVLIRGASIDNATITIDSPERSGPIDIRVDRLWQRLRDDDFLDLEVAGAVGDRSLEVSGELGTWNALLNARDVDIRLDSQVEGFTLTAEGHVDDLVSPKRPTLNLTAKAPDVNGLLELLNIDDPGEGDIDLIATLSEEPGQPLRLQVQGNLGRADIDVTGQFSDLQDYDQAALAFRASGPDIGRLMRLAGFYQVPADEPFTVEIDAQRIGNDVTISRGRLEVATTTAELAANFPDFPSLDDADIDLTIIGSHFERFRAALNLPGASTGPFSLEAELGKQPDGVEIIDLDLQTPLGRLRADGHLGRIPDYVGTELTLDAEIVSLSRLVEQFGLEGMPDVPFTLRGTSRLENDGFHSVGPVVVGFSDLVVSADGSGNFLGGRREAAVTIDASGSDLEFIVGHLVDSTYVPALPFELKGEVELAGTNVEFNSILGNVGTSAVELDGQLSVATDGVVTQVSFAANGPGLAEVLPDTLGFDVTPGPYALSGRLDLDPDVLSLSEIRYEREQGIVTADVTTTVANGERSVEFDVRAEGADVREVLARFSIIDAGEAPFSVDAEGAFRANAVSLEEFDIAIGDAILQIEGDVDLNRSARSSQLHVSLDVPSLAALGSLEGRQLVDRQMKLDAIVESGAGVLNVDELTASLNDSSLTGRLRLEAGDVPKVDMALHADRWEVMPLVVVEEEPYDPEPTFEDGRLIPDLPLPIDAIAEVDATIVASANELRWNDLPMRDVEVELSTSGGEFNLSTLRFNAPRGHLDARARVVPNEGGADVAVELVASNFALGLVNSNRDLDSTSDVNIHLTATGANLRSLATTANGAIYYEMRGGEAESNRFLRAIYGDMLNEIIGVINPFSTVDLVTRFECIIVPLSVTDGLLESAPNVLIRTDKAQVVSDGEIDLNSESINLNFRSRPRRGIVLSAGEVFNPFVKVVGTLAEPRLAVDEQGVLVSGGAAVATGGLSILATGLWRRIAGSRTPCEDLSELSLETLDDQLSTLGSVTEN
jgi:uncharacterized protein involved in outer membrane biogenesis